jgi:iron complex transport system ATP-binding protein
MAVVDADPEPAALVNLIVTLTEVKTDVLRTAGVRCDDGYPATGTSSDAIVVAATGRGTRCRYGGPLTALGWAAASATRVALETGVRRWLADHDAAQRGASS